MMLPSVFLIVFLLLGTPSEASASPGSHAVTYNRDIRPILSENCFRCHGPDKNMRKAKLRLDQREVALEKEAFVPGNADKSELVRRIFTSNPDDLMPPPDSNKKLTADQKELLRRWINEGAIYQPHWAYILPTRPAIPEVKNKSWVANSIDAFVLSELEKKGIQPSPPADNRTLLRRLILDLTGLPPKADEMEQFLSDHSRKAFSKQVTRLLASPHYGERMAVPWLDLARFADTVGYHGDQNQHVFPYRDYVVDSFNSNKPFDQFTIEQIAGDLLPHPTPAQLTATCFNRLNMMTREGGAQPKEYLAKYAADRVRTVSTTWLGSTMGCCECHDHKFDPFSTADFYSMEAFFADIQQWGVYMDYNYTPNPDLKGWSNDHPFPPEIQVPSAYLQKRQDAMASEIKKLLHTASPKELKNESFLAWQSNLVADWKQTQTPWRSLEVVLDKSEKEAKAKLRADGSVLLTEKIPDGFQYTLHSEVGSVAALKLAVIPTPEHEGRILQKGATSQLVQLVAQKQKNGKAESEIHFYYSEAARKTKRFANGYEIPGLQNGWLLDKDALDQPQTSIWCLDPPVQLNEGEDLIIQVKGENLGCIRLYSTRAVQAMVNGMDVNDQLWQITVNSDHSRAGQLELYRAWKVSSPSSEALFDNYKKLFASWRQCENGMGWTMVTQHRDPPITRVLARGNWQDETGAIVSPATPHFLPAKSTEKKGNLSRLDLARWLVSKENPLTARTFVNRLWKQFFGSGLANPVDDLGAQGEPPTHPELLDWLAVEFQESGWNVKHMVELIVNSQTYRQSSKERKDLQEIDPSNRLLAAQNPRRLEGEFVRDNALAIAGLLNLEMGGPSIHPYQPPNYYVNLQFPDRDYYPDQDERQYRRGVYMHWQRTFLHPMLANFDSPSREECSAIRTVSNTPQQALTLLNDPEFVEAARVLAQKLLTPPALTDKARLESAFQRALSRSPNARESDSLLRFLDHQREHYKTDLAEAEKLQHVGLAPADSKIPSAELAAWTQVCRAVLNLNEVITRY